MPDFRVSDARAEDDQLDAAGLAAAGLWALAGSYAMRELTDGWVPERYVRSRKGGPAAARRLVAVGKWTPEDRDGVPGYRFDPGDWADQRTAEQIKTTREETAARMRGLRRRQKDALVRDSGQLTTGLVSVPGDDHRDASRDPERDASRDPVRDTECARLPPPHPLPSGQDEEEGSRSVGPDSPASSSQAPLDEEDPPPGQSTPQRSAHGAFVSWLRGLPAAELAALDRRCDLHAQAAPGTPTPSCTDCQRRRRTIERVIEDQRLTGQVNATSASVRRRVCTGCDELGFRLGDDRRPVEPLERCDHPGVPITAAALVGART